MRMRLASHSVLVCSLVALVALGCGKNDTDGGDSPTGGGGVGAGTAGDSGGSATAGTGGAGDGGETDGGSAGTGSDGGGEAGTGSVDVPPQVADVADAMAGGFCKALVACVGATKLASLVGGEDCKTRVKAEFLADDFARIDASIDGGKVVIDDTKLDSCVAGIEALGCDVQTHDFPADCESVVEGKVAVGEACSISLDCVGNAFCSCTTNKCNALLGSGDTCTEDEECGDDLVCVDHTCKAPGKTGATCAGTSGNVCALGWNCWNGTETMVGECHTNAETLVGDEGDLCDPASTLCKEGLSCSYKGTGSDFVCKKKVASGAACYKSLPGMCPAGEFCNGSAVQEGTCEALPSDGDDCIPSNGVCKAGMVCVRGATMDELVCRPVHDNGGSCKYDDECRSGYCNAAKCEPPPTCN